MRGLYLPICQSPAVIELYIEAAVPGVDLGRKTWGRNKFGIMLMYDTGGESLKVDTLQCWFLFLGSGAQSMYPLIPSTKGRVFQAGSEKLSSNGKFLIEYDYIHTGYGLFCKPKWQV